MITSLYITNWLVFIMATGYVLCDAWTELLFIIQMICLEQLRFSLSVFSYECLALMHIFKLFLREGQEGKDWQPWKKSSAVSDIENSENKINFNLFLNIQKGRENYKCHFLFFLLCSLRSIFFIGFHFSLLLFSTSFLYNFSISFLHYIQSSFLYFFILSFIYLLLYCSPVLNSVMIYSKQIHAGGKAQ